MAVVSSSASESEADSKAYQGYQGKNQGFMPNQVYNQGEKLGYIQGNNQGFNQGNNQGFNQGNNQGYNQGYDEQNLMSLMGQWAQGQNFNMYNLADISE